MVAAFYLIAIISGTVTQTVDATVASTTPDRSFRWDATGQQWIFSVSTTNLGVGSTYVYQISLNDGTNILFPVRPAALIVPSGLRTTRNSWLTSGVPTNPGIEPTTRPIMQSEHHTARRGGEGRACRAVFLPLVNSGFRAASYATAGYEKSA